MGLLYGIAINDAEYIVQPKNKPNCDFYKVWQGMLQRCYDPKLHKKRPNYIGCSVSSEWLLFSSFSSWMKTQDWKGKQLDKDILFQGNKIYSAETCIFVHGSLNSLLTNRSNFRGKYPIGVSFNKKSEKYHSQCRVNGKATSLGFFDTPLEAHEVYKKFKYEVIRKVAEKQAEPLKAALLNYKI
jgi:hypothetical protein